MARRLFEVYRQSLPNANIKVTWPELPDEMQRAWIKVAEEAVRVRYEV